MSDPQFTDETTSAAEIIANLAEEIERLKNELEHAQRLATLGVLAAGVAHEINNILTPVLAYAQLASSNPDDKQLHTKALERAASGVQSATQITQAMLGFAASGDQTDVANVHEALKSALDCIARDPAKDRIKLKIEVPQSLVVNIRPLALQQVFMNLILNAVSAMRGRGGTITVRSSPDRDGMTRLEVSDTGPGIPSDIAGRLFEPFPHSRGRGGFTRSKEKGGTGLGLSICRRIIEEASGSITASSSPGSGTTFSFYLPNATKLHAKAC